MECSSQVRAIISRGDDATASILALLLGIVPDAIDTVTVEADRSRGVLWAASIFATLYHRPARVHVFALDRSRSEFPYGIDAFLNRIDDSLDSPSRWDDYFVPITEDDARSDEYTVRFHDRTRRYYSILFETNSEGGVYGGIFPIQWEELCAESNGIGDYLPR